MPDNWPEPPQAAGSAEDMSSREDARFFELPPFEQDVFGKIYWFDVYE